MARKSFDELYALAVERKGEAALEARLPAPTSSTALAATTDDRWLAAMTRAIFQAGFVWRVIESKWDGFEAAFRGFDPVTVAAFDGDDMTRLRNDAGIVRNGTKIQATVDNARFVFEVAGEHGSFGQRIAAWPREDTVGLWAFLKTEGSRLGGDTGPRVLRAMGRETFILSRDVVASLIAQGIVDSKPTSKGALAKAQEAFLAWADESGRSLSEISMVIAHTIDA